MSLFRSTVWFIKGLKEYTKGGYAAASKNFESLDGNSAEGRSFMITGANSGIGKETARAIAAKGGTVHMVCRNEERGKEALEEIVEETGNSSIHLHILDISDAQSIQQFVNEFTDSDKPLNVLVNNAGCMIHNKELTKDGVEKNFATNTLGTYILTTCLMDHLQKYENPAVITVTSGGMLVQKLDPEDFNSERLSSFDGSMVYAQNKRQQVVMTEQLALKHPKVFFCTMHPGWADTPAVRSALPQFHAKMKNRLRDAAEGADTLIWACLSPSVRTVPSGSFLQDRVAVSKHLPLASTRSSASEDEMFMDNLRKLSEKVLHTNL